MTHADSPWGALLAILLIAWSRGVWLWLRRWWSAYLRRSYLRDSAKAEIVAQDQMMRHFIDGWK